MRRLVGFLCHVWEVSDSLPSKPATALVGMALALNQNGSCSTILFPVLQTVAKFFNTGRVEKVIFSNRQVVNGKNIAEVERDATNHLGGPDVKIIIPKNPRNPRIRNTYEEAKFALRLLRFSPHKGPKSILVVANHLHMRRVLATFRKLLGGRSDIQIFWKSAGDIDDYEKGSAQSRFDHPLFFLLYEIIALPFSKLKGWA